MPFRGRRVKTSTVNALRFSMQFARRIGAFTGRFGIKESTGGFGLDLHLDARERVADAGASSAAEGQVRERRRRSLQEPGGSERFGMWEERSIAMCRPGYEHHEPPGGHGVALDFVVPPWRTAEAPGGRKHAECLVDDGAKPRQLPQLLDPQRLPGRTDDQVGPQERELRGMPGEEHECPGERVGRRLVPRDQQRDELVEDELAGERSSRGLVARREQEIDHVVLRAIARCPASLLDEPLEDATERPAGTSDPEVLGRRHRKRHRESGGDAAIGGELEVGDRRGDLGGRPREIAAEERSAHDLEGRPHGDLVDPHGLAARGEAHGPASGHLTHHFHLTCDALPVEGRQEHPSLLLPRRSAVVREQAIAHEKAKCSIAVCLLSVDAVGIAEDAPDALGAEHDVGFARTDPEAHDGTAGIHPSNEGAERIPRQDARVPEDALGGRRRCQHDQAAPRRAGTFARNQRSKTARSRAGASARSIVRWRCQNGACTIGASPPRTAPSGPKRKLTIAEKRDQIVRSPPTKSPRE